MMTISHLAVNSILMVLSLLLVQVEQQLEFGIWNHQLKETQNQLHNHWEVILVQLRLSLSVRMVSIWQPLQGQMRSNFGIWEDWKISRLWHFQSHSRFDIWCSINLVSRSSHVVDSDSNNYSSQTLRWKFLFFDRDMIMGWNLVTLLNRPFWEIW